MRPTTRPAAAAGLLLFAASCSGGSQAPSQPPSLGTGGTPSAQELSFSGCMRSHGVRNYPDPRSSGAPKESAQQLGVTESQLQAASGSCRYLLPNGGAGPDQVELQQVAALGLAYARCMRAHGIDLPDPAGDGRIADPSSLGIDQGSRPFQAANQACEAYRPPYVPTNAAYNAYSRGQGT